MIKLGLPVMEKERSGEENVKRNLLRTWLICTAEAWSLRLCSE
jgi:hypothetical protein